MPKLTDEMLKELRFASCAQNVQTHGSTIRALLDDLEEYRRLANAEYGRGYQDGKDRRHD